MKFCFVVIFLYFTVIISARPERFFRPYRSKFFFESAIVSFCQSSKTFIADEHTIRLERFDKFKKSHPFLNTISEKYYVAIPLEIYFKYYYCELDLIKFDNGMKIYFTVENYTDKDTIVNFKFQF